MNKKKSENNEISRKKNMRGQKTPYLVLCFYIYTSDGETTTDHYLLHFYFLIRSNLIG